MEDLKDIEAHRKELGAHQKQLDEVAKQTADFMNDLTSKSKKHVRRGLFFLIGVAV